MELIRRNPALRSLVTSRLVSTIGTWLAYIALVADVYDRTRSSHWVAALLIVEFLPSIAVAAVGGLIDRLPRKRLLIGAELTGLGVFAALPFVSAPAAIVGLAAVAGTAGAVFQPALMAGLPNLVAAEDLAAASGLNQTMSTAGLAVGPALGGLVVAWAGVGTAFAVDAASFAISATVLSRIPARALQVTAYEGGLWEGARGAIRLVRTTPVLRTIFWTSAFALLGGAAVNVGEVFLARGTFGSGTVGFGVLATGIGAGLVLGSARSARVVTRLGAAETYRVGLLVAALGIAGAALSPDVWVAAGCTIVAGVGNALFLAGRSNVLQTEIADESRGSAFALLYGSGDVATSAGMVAAGIAISAFGARGIWLAGAAVFAVACAGATARRRQRADVPVPAST